MILDRNLSTSSFQSGVTAHQLTCHLRYVTFRAFERLVAVRAAYGLDYWQGLPNEIYRGVAHPEGVSEWKAVLFRT
jgi:hypothetical protein